MKLLFISARDVIVRPNGAFLCTNRNYLSFCKILGKDNVEVMNLISEEKKPFYWSIVRRINLLFGYFEGLSRKQINNIIKTAREYEYVYIDTSTYGVIAAHLKKAKFKGKIICFFHNVEYNIERQNLKNTPLKFLAIPIFYYNEKKACKYSDKVVVLNKRDSNELMRLYGIINTNIIPMSLFDTLNYEIEERTTSLPPTFLYFGNYWYANIHGLKWFIHNVFDYVNIKLQIVGSGMDKLRTKFVHPNIEFLGFVPDLSTVLKDADYVISPIFIGSGMKVKTCESLMHGKNIIGTKEAFEGYEIDYNEVGAICNNKEEFISTIKNYCSIKRKKFNAYSRKCFLEKYSFEATLGKFDELLFN